MNHRHPTIKLSDVCSIQSGGTPSRKESSYWGGTIPWAKISDIENAIDGYLSDTEEHITVEGLHSIRNRIFSDGTLLFAMYGSVGKTAIVKGEISTNQAILGIKPLNDDEVDLSYLMHWFRSQQAKFERDAQGVAQKNLSAGYIRDLWIPLPPLKEQKRIAAILDKADSLRRKRQQAIQLADQFLRAVFLDMFGDPVTNPKGWEEAPLHAVADIRSGITKNKSLQDKNSVVLPYMRVANVQDGYLDLSEIQEIHVPSKDIERYSLKRGDILLTEGGDPDKLGRGYVWNEEVKGCVHQNHVFAVRIKNSRTLNPLYLSALIGSVRGKRYFLKMGKQTTGIATINKTVLSDFTVLLPPRELQASYQDVVERVRCIKDRFSQDDMVLLKSISHAAFAHGI